MKVSIGICAYNEEKNIGILLSNLVHEPLIDQIIVVASGCTDRTAEIASEWLTYYENGKLITEDQRNGKAHAINLFIQNAEADVLILESADTLPGKDCFRHLLAPLVMNANIGMVGAHPVPVNNCDTRMNKVGHLLWSAHHHMALKHPKAGEVCAFRNVIPRINPNTAVDEASIEAQLVWQGFRVVYAPNAIIYNKAPETPGDFIRQRKRIYHGHLHLKHDTGYSVPSMSIPNIAHATLKACGIKGLKTAFYASILELYARFYASYTFQKDKTSPTIWDMCHTTKELK